MKSVTFFEKIKIPEKLGRYAILFKKNYKSKLLENLASDII